MNITLKKSDEFPDSSDGNFRMVPKAAGTYEVERRETFGRDWYFFLGSNIGAKVEYFYRLARKGKAVIEGDPLFTLELKEVAK